MTDIRFGSMLIEDTGEGSPVVMIHGLGGSSNSFQTLMGDPSSSPRLPPVRRSREAAARAMARTILS